MDNTVLIAAMIMPWQAVAMSDPSLRICSQKGCESGS